MQKTGLTYAQALSRAAQGARLRPRRDRRGRRAAPARAPRCPRAVPATTDVLIAQRAAVLRDAIAARDVSRPPSPRSATARPSCGASVRHAHLRRRRRRTPPTRRSSISRRSTKPIATTSVLLRLVDGTRDRPRRSVASHFPEWRGGDREAVTVQDLLEHASGLPARLVDPPPEAPREFEHDICAIAARVRAADAVDLQRSRLHPAGVSRGRSRRRAARAPVRSVRRA